MAYMEHMLLLWNHYDTYHIYIYMLQVSTNHMKFHSHYIILYIHLYIKVVL